MKMENVNVRFEMEKDSDLIEACIYEMESLRARYGTCSAWPNSRD